MEPWMTLDQLVADYLPQMPWLHDEPMKNHTSLRIGGPAKRMALPRSREELVILLGLCEQAHAPSFLLGNGTNLLVADEGLSRVVISTAKLDQIEFDGEEISVDAGVSLARLAVFAWQRELTGLEFAHGIPGSLGGGVVMNAGAYGGELRDVLVSVTAVFPDGVRTLPVDELGLGYRKSIFLDAPDTAVLSARIRLQKGDGAAIKARMDELMAKRRASQPLELPSAGSTFKRPEGHFAGTLIEQCGLKGTRVGGAEVSRKHAGFLVNVGGATCADMLALIETVQHTVFDKTGVRLEPEVRLLR